jgi:hypothetical protein
VEKDPVAFTNAVKSSSTMPPSGDVAPGSVMASKEKDGDVVVSHRITGPRPSDCLR